ncbi:MAG TPA: RloB family protein [Lachnospiraceae bacterium]|jgi:hypothetical protein|nr:RloB family protein [Lachnospiraceae bacterium]
MAPIRNYTNWNKRPSDKLAQIEPYRKYVFICEGANTETWYFEHLIDIKKDLNIKPTIFLELWEKTEADRDISYPRKLIEFANEKKCDKTLDFDPDHDKMIIIFDADIYEAKALGYDETVELGEKDNTLGVTNPNFELFLLLHFPDAYETIIKPHAGELLENKKTGNQRYSYSLLLSLTGINSKTNDDIGNLADNVLTAIAEEKHLNQDIHQCLGQLTCNIGSIIEGIIEDRLN